MMVVSYICFLTTDEKSFRSYLFQYQEGNNFGFHSIWQLIGGLFFQALRYLFIFYFLIDFVRIRAAGHTYPKNCKGKKSPSPPKETHIEKSQTYFKQN